MAQYDNNMRGVLFKNTRQRDGKRDPQYQGHIEIEGKQFWLDAWINESNKDGTKFMSLKLRPKLAKDMGAVPHKEPEPAKAQDGFNDDIPF